MNLLEAILAEHSKSQKNKIVKWVGHSQARFDELMRLFLTGEYVVTQRAGYPLSYCVSEHPEFVIKHLGKLLINLKKKDLHTAVKRNTVRILRDIDIPKRYHGKVMNICFEYIQSNEELVGVKAFSLAILEKLLPLYPDIHNELKLIIEERWPHETAAFRSRAKKVLGVRF
jgi:hypothetical protein